MFDHNLLVLAGIACLSILAMLAIDRGCKCEKCAFHQNEARVKRLASATEWHRRFHRQYGIPWDPSKCPTCESKGTGDQP